MFKAHIVIGSLLVMFLSWQIHADNQSWAVAPASTTTSTVVEVPATVPPTTSTTTTTTTTTVVAEQVGRLSVPADTTRRCPDLEPVFEAYGMTPVDTWSYIAWRESRCTAKAIGWNYHKGMSRADCGSGVYEVHRKCAAVRSWDMGYLQVNSSWRSVTRRICGGPIELLLTLDCNFRVARWLHANGGFGHWRVAD